MFLPSSRLPSFSKPFPSGTLNQLIRQIVVNFLLYFKLILSTKICSSCRCYSIFVQHLNIFYSQLYETLCKDRRQDPNSNINGQCMDLCCVWSSISHISGAVITSFHSVMYSQLHTKLCWYKKTEHSGIISHTAYTPNFWSSCNRPDLTPYWYTIVPITACTVLRHSWRWV
jgi:hypothetical protein